MTGTPPIAALTWGQRLRRVLEFDITVPRLHAIVELSLPHLCASLTEQDASLPAFVTWELRDHLSCGPFAHDFIRVKCNRCRHEHLAWPAA